MKVVNPREGKCPTVVIDEPFMLACLRTGLYYRVVITLYGILPYTNGYKYVIKGTQRPTVSRGDFIEVFTVRSISTGRDLYKSLDEIVQLITSNDYEFTHVR